MLHGKSKHGKIAGLLEVCISSLFFAGLILIIGYPFFVTPSPLLTQVLKSDLLISRGGFDFDVKDGFTATFGNTTIESDSKEALDSILSYLNVSDGIPYIEKVVYVGQLGDCYAGTDMVGHILITGCQKDELLYGGWYVVNPDLWLPFTLYHEIGHNKFSSVDEALVNEYAANMTGKLGFMVIQIRSG